MYSERSQTSTALRVFRSRLKTALKAVSWSHGLHCTGGGVKPLSFSPKLFVRRMPIKWKKAAKILCTEIKLQTEIGKMKG